MADLCNFQVDIIPDQGSVTTNKKNDSYYVEMPEDNIQYRIRLKNSGAPKCDAVVTIDGKNMGKFRINSYSHMVLERPADVERRFTFFVGGSDGSKQGGYQPKERNNGLIEVVFKPEKQLIHVYRESCLEKYKEMHSDDDNCGEEMCSDDDVHHAMGMPAPRSLNCGSVPTCMGTESSGPEAKRMTDAPTSRYKEGMTALTGESSQKFVTVATLDYDLKNEVTIYLRLVYKDIRPKIEPLRSVGTKKTRYPNPV